MVGNPLSARTSLCSRHLICMYNGVIISPPEPSHLPRTCGSLTARPTVVKRSSAESEQKMTMQEDRSQRSGASQQESQRPRPRDGEANQQRGWVGDELGCGGPQTETRASSRGGGCQSSADGLIPEPLNRADGRVAQWTGHQDSVVAKVPYSSKQW